MRTSWVASDPSDTERRERVVSFRESELVPHDERHAERYTRRANGERVYRNVAARA